GQRRSGRAVRYDSSHPGRPGRRRADRRVRIHDGAGARWLRGSHAAALPEGGRGVTTIRLDRVSRWFKNVVGVSEVSMTIRPGVTGLLGPNGAGKSTLIALMSGFLAPSAGSVTLDGEPLWRNAQSYAAIGLVPEREALLDYLTGREFAVANAELHGLRDPGLAAERAMALVEMT